MKVAFAVIVSFVIFLLGWLFLASLLYGLAYVAAMAQNGISMMHYLNLLMMWFLGPGFGGYLATNIAPKIFKDVNAATIATSFISSVITLSVVLGLISVAALINNEFSFGGFIIFIIQVISIILGAKIGSAIHEHRA